LHDLLVEVLCHPAFHFVLDLVEPLPGRILRRNHAHRQGPLETEPGIEGRQAALAARSVERAYVNSAYPGRSSGFLQSTRFLQDASYIRLKNVRFGYNVPPQFVQNAGFTRGRIYVQGTNLITLTNYPGIDPEVVGTNNAVYPQSRIISAGLEIGF
jgi:hypothetical protein